MQRSTLLLWCDEHRGSTATEVLAEPRYYKRTVPSYADDYDCMGYDNVFLIYRKNVTKEVDERFVTIYNNIRKHRKLNVLFEMPDQYLYREGREKIDEGIRKVCSFLGINDSIVYVGPKSKHLKEYGYSMRINNIDTSEYGATVVPFGIDEPLYSLEGRNERKDVIKGRILSIIETIIIILPYGGTASIDLHESKTAWIYREWRNYRNDPDWEEMFFDIREHND